MEIVSIEYKNVYGTLSGKLSFKRGENFIVGINGCGKTTVINLINWLLSPNMPELCTLDHESIKVIVKHKSVRYTIVSKIVKDKHFLEVSSEVKVLEFQPIITPLISDPKSIRNAPYIEDIKSEYSRLRPDESEIVAWSFLREELPSPVFVGLGRYVHGPTRFRKEDAKKRKSPENVRKSKNAIDAAGGLMRDAYNSSRRRVVEINDDLNCKVIELSFSGILSEKNLTKKITKHFGQDKTAKK